MLGALSPKTCLRRSTIAAGKMNELQKIISIARSN
jgi:hypothetical protein